MGDADPDDSYSSVAYEKGFTFLLYLERLVGSKAFEGFFQAYIARFASQILTSDDFKDFSCSTFKTTTTLWNRSIGIQSWSSLQITCFLDALQSMCESKPLQLSTIKAMNDHYHFGESRNSEILHWYSELAVPAEDSTILPIAVRFITTQGRMKFVWSLYRALYKSQMGNELAVETFLKHKDFYHPICAKIIDLRLAGGGKESSSQQQLLLHPKVLTGCAIVATTVALVLMQRRK
jgi:leukotriene-A4 hydrolase